MVIRVIDVVDKAVTAADGLIVRDVIKQCYLKDGNAVISFEEVPYITSSFLNSSLISLVEELGFETFKAWTTVTNANGQVADTIRYRFRNFANAR